MTDTTEWDNSDDEFNSNEQKDEFPSIPNILGSTDNKNNDETAPDLNKQGTIYVTQQLRYFDMLYEVVGPIGEPGQFGMAYECYLKNDPNQTRRCVKEINKARFHHIDADARDEILRTMQNEITTLKQVDHDNIVKLYDVFEDRHKLHLVMEFLPGGELFARICEYDHLSEAVAAKILKQILSALDHMHDKNILHLDLKPDNILFASKDENAEIKLIDFGMARAVPRLAKLKDRVGTPNYMAPEVFNGSYSKAADVWSVGVILFCMLFGFPPFYIDDDDLVIDEHKQLEAKIKKGFIPEVREGYGPWFPEDIPISEQCQHLLSMMLDMNVKERWTVKECLSSLWLQGNAPDNKISPIVLKSLQKFQATSKFKVAVSNIFASHLDQDHVETVKTFFKKLDKDGDGKLTLEEFIEGMKDKFDNDELINDAQLTRIFNNIDIDGNKTITIDELITICAHRALIDEDERLFELFREIDENGDGLLTMEEIEKAMKQFHKEHKGHNQKKVMQKVKTAFKLADVNDDGTIDYEAFLRMIHPEFSDELTFDEFRTGHIENKVTTAHFNIRMASIAQDSYNTLKPEERKKINKMIKAKSKRRLLNIETNRKMRNKNRHLKTTSLDCIMGLNPGNLFASKSDASGLNGNITTGMSVKSKINKPLSASSNNLFDDWKKKSNNDVQNMHELKKLKMENGNYKSEILKLKRALESKDDDIKELNENILSLNNKNDELRNKYENELNKNKQNNDKIEMMFNKNMLDSNKNNEAFLNLQNEINSKNKQMNDKDNIIISLTQSLDNKQKTIESLNDENIKSQKKIQELTKLLNNAVQSKMKSLVQSQKEIAKLRELLKKANKNHIKTRNGKSINNGNSSNNNNLKVLKKQKTRHLSFGYFDWGN